MRKILLLALLVPIIFIVYLISVKTINAEQSENSSIYIVSENSFEHSQETYFYYETLDSQISYQSSASKLLGYVWTRAGDVTNIIKNLLARNNNPVSGAQGASVYFASNSGGGILSITKINKIPVAGHAIFGARGHPWFFLMTLSFGTILLSLWFLRFSTGVSPPGLDVRFKI